MADADNAAPTPQRGIRWHRGLFRCYIVFAVWVAGYFGAYSLPTWRKYEASLARCTGTVAPSPGSIFPDLQVQLAEVLRDKERARAGEALSELRLTLWLAGMLALAPWFVHGLVYWLYRGFYPARECSATDPPPPENGTGTEAS